MADIAAAAGMHEVNARRWLRRCHEDGVLYWASKVGRGAVSRLGLVAENARVCRVVNAFKKRLDRNNALNKTQSHFNAVVLRPRSRVGRLIPYL